MRKPEFITFTGADDRTDIKRMDAIAQAYPVEWGFLMSPSNRDARFPSTQALAEMLSAQGRKALHLCGAHATAAAMLDFDATVLPALALVSRVQINGRIMGQVMVRELAEQHDVEVILQTRNNRFPDTDLCYFLYDASGGRGLIAEALPPLPAGPKLVGYAGGFGPETVLDQLAKIDGAADGRFWIDMESRVRKDGWFDLDAVERVCELVYGRS